MEPSGIYASSDDLKFYQSLNEYIRLNIHLKDGHGFPVIVPISNTIEELVSLIEATFTLIYCKNLAFDDGQTPIRKQLQIYQLFDSENTVLKNYEIVKDVLIFDDDIYPVNILDGVSHSAYSLTEGTEAAEATDLNPALESINENALQKSDTKLKIAELPQDSVLSIVPDSSTIDDRLESLLHNLRALDFFIEFCLNEYAIENLLFWIEAKVFLSIPLYLAKEKATFSNHLWNTYIKELSPLALNFNSETRSKIHENYGPGQIDAVAELQSMIALLIRKTAYIKFEESEYFQNFLKFKSEDRYGYLQGITGWNFEMLNTGNVLINSINESSKLESDTTPIYREKILLDTIERYFSKSSKKITKKYFDSNERASKSRKRKHLRKKKRLAKFFGDQPDDDELFHQRISSESISGYHDHSKTRSTLEMDDEDYSNSDKRKKMNKLSGFFGSNLTGQQVQTQGLSYKELAKSVAQESFHSLENHDKQTVTRVQKLKTVLGIENLPPALTLRKMVDVLEKMTEDEIENVPLSPIQKRKLQKTNMKLEQMFGNTVPVQSIIALKNEVHHDDQVSSPYQSETRSARQSVCENVDKQTNIKHLRKIKRVLGLDDFPPEVAINQISFALNSLATQELENQKMALLYQDLDEDQTTPQFTPKMMMADTTKSHLSNLTLEPESSILDSEIDVFIRKATQRSTGWIIDNLDKKTKADRLSKLKLILGVDLLPPKLALDSIFDAINGLGSVDDIQDHEEGSYWSSSLDDKKKQAMNENMISDDPKERKRTIIQRIKKLRKVLGIQECSPDLVLQKIYENTSLSDQHFTLDDFTNSRPLTPHEKRKFQKKNKKLELMFGKMVPSNNLIQYGPQSPTEDSEEEKEKIKASADDFIHSLHLSATISEDLAFQAEEEKKLSVHRFNKLKKILGVTEASSSGETFNQIYSLKRTLLTELKRPQH